MNRYIVSFLIFTVSLFAENIEINEKNISTEELVEEKYRPNVDCLILEDENSIICKFEVIRDPLNDQLITINWINPNGEVSRTREMTIHAGDNSAYDYRYIKGREKGVWNFEVLYNDEKYSTQFELK